jgi:hypothetical protein
MICYHSSHNVDFLLDVSELLLDRTSSRRLERRPVGRVEKSG